MSKHFPYYCLYFCRIKQKVYFRFESTPLKAQNSSPDSSTVHPTVQQFFGQQFTQQFFEQLFVSHHLVFSALTGYNNYGIGSGRSADSRGIVGV